MFSIFNEVPAIIFHCDFDIQLRIDVIEKWYRYGSLQLNVFIVLIFRLYLLQHFDKRGRLVSMPMFSLI